MKQNTKTVALTLLATTIVAAGATFASGVTNTSTGNTFGNRLQLTTEQKAEFDAIKTILEKQKAGTELTADEQTQLEEFQADRGQRGGFCMGKGGHKGRGEHEMGGRMMGGGFGLNELTDEEKTALESMTDDEKKAFFDSKRTQNEAKMEAREAVIDKLLNGETLTADEEKLRKEMKIQRAEQKAKRAQMKEIRILMEKQKAGTTLTTDEQAKVDAFKANMPDQEGKGFGKKW